MAAFATLAALATPNSARSQTVDAQPDSAVSNVALRWAAPVECPTREEVLGDVRSLVVHPREGAHTAGAIDAVVEKLAEGRWTVTLSLGAAQRRIAASSCQQIARATALFVALVVDGSSSEPQANTAPIAAPPEKPPPFPTQTGAPTSPRPVARKVDAPETSILVGAGPAVETGILPHPEWLGAFQIGFRYRRVELTLEAAAGPAQTTGTGNLAGARLWPLIGTVKPCYAPLWVGRLRLGPCLQGEIGALSVSGTDVSRGRSGAAPWLSLGGGLAASWILGAWVEARGEFGALAPVVRPNLEVSGYQAPGPAYATRTASVFEPGLGLRAEAAFVFRF